MPKLTNGRVPKMRHHKIKSKTGHPGYAMVTLGGVDVHLGRWDDPESEVRYNEQVAQWLSNGRKVVETKGTARTVGDLCGRWVAYAAEYYQKDGEPTSEVRLSKAAADGARALFGSLEIRDFNNTHLEMIQKHWIRQGASRGTVNAYTTRVKAMFRWGVNQKFLDGAQWHGIAATASVGRGRMGAKDTEAVEPASDEQIDAVLEVAAPRLAAKIQMQRFTGMRPGEVCRMRACDIDRSGEVWVYRPKFHKTQHHGIVRSVMIGPMGQEVLRDWIDRRNPGDYLFSQNPSKPGSPTSYHESLTNACKVAGVEAFSPNQIRHSFATRILNTEGCDIKDAQGLLGHQHATTTARYAKMELGRVANVAAKLG